MRTRRFAFVSALLAVPTIAACGTNFASTAELVGSWDGTAGGTIDVKKNGSARGNDGCNDVEAAWKSTGDKAGKFQITGGSEKGCPGIEGWWDATAYKIADDTLTLEDGEGRELAVFERTN